MVDPYSKYARETFTECTGIEIPLPDFGPTWDEQLPLADQAFLAANEFWLQSVDDLELLPSQISEKSVEEIKLRAQAIEYTNRYAVEVENPESV